MTTAHVSRYSVPRQWLRYDIAAIAGLLIEAKTAASVLTRLPYLPQWIEQAHEEQLQLEAVGTSRIEGAEFTQREQDEALSPDAAMLTRRTSPRQRGGPWRTQLLLELAMYWIHMRVTADITVAGLGKGRFGYLQQFHLCHIPQAPPE